MRNLWRSVRRAWDRHRAARYQRGLVREERDRQAFEDREERHRAGIFEPPHGGL